MARHQATAGMVQWSDSTGEWLCSTGLIFDVTSLLERQVVNTFKLARIRVCTKCIKSTHNEEMVLFSYVRNL